MKCTNCGANMLETDQFCPKCGAKAIKDRKCPDCGAVLREGTQFCHKCGRPIAGKSGGRNVSDETLDIPIDAIERNILSETAAKIRSDSGNAVKSSSPKTKKTTPEPPQKKSAPASYPKKRTVYREEELEEEEWEDDDWDDDDDDDEGVDVITIMTVIAGCVLLVVVAVLGYHLYRQYAPKNYKNLAEESEIESEDGNTEFQGQELEDGWEVEIGELETPYTLTVTHNVNVRDNPSTSDSNILKVAKEGETYTCYGSVENGEWYEILLDDGAVGYVFHEYVTVND
ncbi:MAG: zinc-ribbon domain-containing protein [Lachnospiraceae bacterium]|nr:zinc-ribbon domain-containing protein [Lachnospiraceae bacterium]